MHGTGQPGPAVFSRRDSPTGETPPARFPRVYVTIALHATARAGVPCGRVPRARAGPVDAHPVPFSYLDVQVQKNGARRVLVVHIFDVAHDLQVAPPERLLEPAVVAERASAIRALLAPRLELVRRRSTADARMVGAGDSARTPVAAPAPALPGRRRRPARWRVNTIMFHADPQHQTFVNMRGRDADVADDPRRQASAPRIFRRARGRACWPS